MLTLTIVVAVAALLLWALAGSDRGARTDRSTAAIDCDEPAAPKRAEEEAAPDAPTSRVRVFGSVRDQAGQPIAGARVQCLMDKQAGLRAQTNAEGAFEFGAVDGRSEYSLVAISAHGAGVAMARPNGSECEVKITLTPVFFAWFSVVSETGAPVTVSGETLAFVDGPAFWKSPADTDARTNALFRALEISPDAFPANTLCAFYASRDQTLVRGTTGTLLRVPGYRPAILPYIREPLIDWPKSETVMLRGDGTALQRYEVVLPEIVVPKGWSSELVPEIKLVVGLDPPTIANGREFPRPHRLVTRSSPGFSLPRGDAFHIYQQNGLRLPHVLRSEGERLLVLPTYPEYGFLEVSFGAIRPDGPHAILAKHMNTRTSVYGTRVTPGVVRFGPIPVGRYRLVLYEGPVRGVNPTKSIDGMEVKKGVNRYEWAK